MTGLASDATAGLTLRGELSLCARFDAAQGKTVATRQFHRGALSVMRPLYLDDSGQLSLFILNPGGGYVSGDDYLIDVAVEDDAALVMTTQSATKVYRTTGLPARQRLHATIGAGAVCEYLPDQLIVYRDGSYLQESEFVLHPTAHLLLTEVITAGWSPGKENFSFADIRMRTTVTVADAQEIPRPLVIDNLRLVPADFGYDMGVMEGFTHVGQLLLVDQRIDEPLVAALHELADASGCRTGLSVTAAPFSCANGQPAPQVVTMRSLGTSTDQLTRLHTLATNLIRARLHGRPAINLRKY